MSEQDSKQFLRALLVLSPDAYQPSPPPLPRSRVGGDPRYGMRGGGRRAKAESIQFLKQHTLPHSHLYAVMYEDEAGLLWTSFSYLNQDERGYWYEIGSSCRTAGEQWRPTKSAPWIHLSGGNGNGSFWAGGYITENAPDAHLVRLICPNGPILEDTVEHGIVLFQNKPHVELPIQVEVYTRSRELIGGQNFLDGAASGYP